MHVESAPGFPAETALLDQPLQRFDVAAAIPYMLDLRERWRGRCLSEMAEALRERAFDVAPRRK